MSTEKRNSSKKEKATDFEIWSDHFMVVAFFIFMVSLSLMLS
ncbi:hypothetical protein [Salinimicrobium oceani]|nr:hypothetical protein [Salinimicrobium oceani]